MPQYRIVPLRQCPDLAGPAAEWFAAKWGIPIAEYRASIDASLQAPDRVPQWYLALDGGLIAAGAGLIENDFHDRPDLAPNLCALCVQPPHRGRGLARQLLDHIRSDAARMGVDRLYLVTDHTDFYERCGWQFLTTVHDESGQPERMYTAPCPPPAGKEAAP